MNTKKLFPINVLLIATLWIISACGSTETPIQQNNIENISITENRTVLGQITQEVFFDQCNAAGPIKATVQFSEGSSESTQKELVLTAGGEVGAALPLGGANAKLQGAIEQHFVAVRGSTSGYQQSIEITIPAHVRQKYTSIWQEIRSEGTITYTENGELKSSNYSYRIGLQFVSSVARDLSCDETPTPTVSPVPLSPTPVSSPITNMVTPEPPSPIVKGCISSQSWKADSTDQVILNGVTEQPNACYETGSLGISTNSSGKLFLLNQSKPKSLSAGIYTPINNNSVIEFSIHVSSMYLIYAEPSVYISFAVAPLSDPMATKNTARFKLQVEDTINSPVIYFVLADAGENAGVKITDQHYEYGRTYDIRFELAGSVMRLYINNMKQNENLSIPDGEKIFYIGYNLPVLAGIDAEVTNIKVDGIAR